MKKVTICLGLIFIFSGCCTTKFSEETAKAVHIWKENTTYLSNALENVLDGKNPSLHEKTPGGGKHSCLVFPDRHDKHKDHLKALIHATKKLSNTFDELAQKRKCGN